MALHEAALLLPTASSMMTLCTSDDLCSTEVSEDMDCFMETLIDDYADGHLCTPTPGLQTTPAPDPQGVSPCSVTREFQWALSQTITTMADEVCRDAKEAEIGRVYEQMEAAVMHEILADLEDELVPIYLQAAAERVSPERREQLLWHVVATPAMMREFSSHVAASPPIASC